MSRGVLWSQGDAVQGVTWTIKFTTWETSVITFAHVTWRWYLESTLPIWQKECQADRLAGHKGRGGAPDLSSPDEYTKSTASWQIKRPIGNVQIPNFDNWGFQTSGGALWICLVLIDHMGVIQSADHFSMGESIASRAKMTHWWWWGESYLNVIWNENAASQQISVNRFEFLYNLSVLDQASEAFHHWTNNRYHPSYLNYHDRCVLTPCFMRNFFCLTAAVYVHRSPPSSTSTAPAAIAVAVAEIGMPIHQIYQTSSEPPQLPVQSRWMQMLSAVLSCNYQSRHILPILLLELLLHKLTIQKLGVLETGH